MINLRPLFNVTKKNVIDNAPTILSAIGAFGVVSTAVLAVKATKDANDALYYNHKILGKPKTRKESYLRFVTVTWRYYLPAVISGATAIGCIAFAQSTNLKRQAALISAYSITNEALKEYKVQATEMLGKTKSAELDQRVAKKQIDNNPPEQNKVVIVDNKETLCYDSFSGRYFKSDIESIRKAVNDINAELLYNNYASLNDFYDKLGLEPTDIGHELGWSSSKLVEIEISTHLSKDNRPCLSFMLKTEPYRKYWRIG